MRCVKWPSGTVTDDNTSLTRSLLTRNSLGLKGSECHKATSAVDRNRPRNRSNRRQKMLITGIARYVLSRVLPGLLPSSTDGWTLEFMAKPYRTGLGVRASNAWMRTVIRAGLPMWSFRVLTVSGRRTGRAIQTPLAVFEQDGRRYLVTTSSVVLIDVASTIISSDN